MRILIADDSRTSRGQLEAAVGALGHDVHLVEDGRLAWEFLEREHVDVLITDWLMPHVTGEELCRRVRAAAEHSDLGYTYVILLTSLEERAHAVAAMRAGADDFLTKPLDSHDLEVRLLAAERVTRLHRKLVDSQRELSELNTRLHSDARVDRLTGAGNRLRLDEDLAAVAARAGRSDAPFCVALFDVDHFKAYNDTCGHPAGDEVLRQVADALQRVSRGGDTVYRYGGEELLVLFPDTPLRSACIAVERMRAEVERLAITHPGTNPPGRVTVSAGVAEHPPALECELATLVKSVDDALYSAKRAGRNRVVVAQDVSVADGPTKVLVVEDSLTQALAMRMALEAEGFAVAVVTHAASALTVAREERPNLILADYRMPDLDGPALCRALHADPHLAATPVLIATAGEVGDAERAAAMEAGAEAIVSKSDVMNALIGRLKSVPEPVADPESEPEPELVA